MSEPVLTVTELRVGAGARAVVVEDVSFELAAGEALGIVGESGSGKTTVAQALLGYAHAKGQRYLDTILLFEAMGGTWRHWVASVRR